MSKLTLTGLKLIVNKGELHDSRAVSDAIAARAEQAVQLVRSFDQINDPALQRALLTLIQSLAAASRPVA